MKARGRRPSAFIVFECLETPLWNPMHGFLKELFNRASGIKENGNIHEFFTCCLQVCCYEKLYCYGDLSFQKGCEQCYHNAVDDYKIKV